MEKMLIWFLFSQFMPKSHDFHFQKWYFLTVLALIIKYWTKSYLVEFHSLCCQTLNYIPCDENKMINGFSHQGRLFVLVFCGPLSHCSIDVSFQIFCFHFVFRSFILFSSFAVFHNFFLSFLQHSYRILCSFILFYFNVKVYSHTLTTSQFICSSYRRNVAAF